MSTPKEGRGWDCTQIPAHRMHVTRTRDPHTIPVLLPQGSAVCSPGCSGLAWLQGCFGCVLSLGSFLPLLKAQFL